MNSLNDTIAAIATSPGEGGISVIRISGNEAFEVVKSLISKDKSGLSKINPADEKSHTIHFGYILEINSVIDEVLVSIFKAPHSYTGEDVIEISTHGGFFIPQKILSLLLKSGIRHAGPGEFTKRAFLNGKMDLSQAEAVADLIKSKTDSAHLSSIRQLEGSLTDLVNTAKSDIINIISLVELELDFAEEGLELIKKEEIKNKIVILKEKLITIIDSYIKGKVIREGVNLVIAGKPNSGKSSLFNYLLKTNRAIVSEIAGTTRDYIAESLILNGVLFNLTDTAGLRSSEDIVESEGIKRSYKRIEEADLILYLIDSTEKEENIIIDIENFNKNFEPEKSIIVFSKSDLNEKIKYSVGIKISLLKDNTIEYLKNEMTEKVFSGKIKLLSGEITITNLRHKICLENVVASLTEAAESIDRKMSGEFVSVDLRNALKYLSEITGEVTNDEILNNIFGNFCIGK